MTTPIGNIGVALCWEMLRYDTARRMSGKVDLVLSGSCWWDLPIDAPPERNALRQFNQDLARETPVTFAKLLGVPVAHACHCGKVTAQSFPDGDKIQTRRLVGAVQITDGDGHVLARRDFSQGAGLVISDISWDSATRQKTRTYPPDYWIPDLPTSYKNAWETLNPKGKHFYNTVTLPYYIEQYKTMDQYTE